MSIYSVKGKGWRYDFTHKGSRHTEAWFKTKTEARVAEVAKRKELKSPKTGVDPLIDITFFELVNKRLDHVKAYNSVHHYQAYVCMARRWVKNWGKLSASDITTEMVEEFILGRSEVSTITANREIQSLRATFNFWLKKKLIKKNPINGMAYMPVDKLIKYTPSSADIDKVISVADPDTQDYLWVLRETMARVSEVNRLIWDDVDLNKRQMTLYTRKKKGGHLTPRTVPMTAKLFSVVSNRFAKRDQSKPWVFWQTFWSSKTGKKTEGPYQDRKKIMRTLCRKAGVRYFRFHPLRHAGASLMDNSNVPIGAIQKILGHENRTTTEIYLHSIGDAERDAISIYERARQNSHTDSHTEKNSGLEL
jgi:integrase